MSNTYIPVELRRTVARRANKLCKYCLLHEDDAYFGCQVDHIISEKHGGLTTSENLAYACAFCNRHKGSDVGSIVEQNRFVRFYNPRLDHWALHFQLAGAEITPLTDIGTATVHILLFNHPEQLLERQTLQAQNRYLARSNCLSLPVL